ncbi:Na(+)/H(+) antiporter subunit D1 [Clostridium tepidiprofundi DSM 19306]|uniref:Na(+)/H(+) antiporter subunit D1 n=1 Tax=Clostridium tepidiprofundi DSM 19306 TaxID=1121338 RepID=A0A151B5T5_9CLOT|nr:proton-conducting transporter membrane subunit [Clostridium tepidiprofundi]KYH35288.1 Na(+)/H(+) antiporter subunit D1 [Clostridium tepidiprofundi DSM 19306]
MNSVLFLITIPLIGAFLALFTKKANRSIATLIALFMEIFTISIYISGKLPASVAIGGWPAPYGINFVLTPLSVGFVILINLAAIISLLLIREEKSYQFYSTFLVLLAASNGIVLTGDIFNFYIFSELTTFAITALIAYTRDRKSTGAAIKYLILASASSAFLLIGIGVLYKTLGTLNIADIASKVTLLNSATLQLIMILMFAGIFVELELFPFNMWVPKAYIAAKTSVNIMLHGMLGTAGAYVITRILLTMFSNGNAVFIDGNIAKIILIIAMLTIIISETAAFAERNIKKVLAFSSMGQMGLILFGFMIGNEQAIRGAFYVVIANFLAKTVLFILTGEFMTIVKSDKWEDMKGLGRKYPVAGVAFIIASLSLMGMPLFAGFWGKLGIIQGAMSGNGVIMTGVVIILITAVIEGIYFLKIAHTLFLEKDENIEFTSKLRVHSTIIAGVLALVIVIIGVHPGLLGSNIDKASNELLKSVPNYVQIVFPGR